ncbi:MAG: S-layer homology domain-containing protein [Clostridia bacterium]|nr:S-layer homology domain-containing protein [Clostridia bacterium]
MKKILSLILSALFLAGCLPLIAAGGGLPFRDVGESDWFFAPVSYVYDNSIMKGVSDKLFAPEEPVTRAMFVTMLGRLDGVEEKVTDAFVDVDPVEGSWYAGYVGWAADNGIVNGYPGRKFNPDGKLTREEMAALISRYVKYTGILPMISYDPVSFFRDEEKISSWAKRNVEDMRVLGIVTGNSDGTFNPAGNLTRAEAATVMARLDKMIKSLALGDPIKPDYSVDGGAFVLMGAWDLYYAGTAFGSEYEGVGIFTDEDIPYLAEDPDDPMFIIGASSNNRDGTGRGRAKNENPLVTENTFEIDAVNACIDLKKFPFLRIGFASEGVTEFGVYTDNRGSGKVSMFVSSEADGWSYGLVDLRETLAVSGESGRISLTLIGSAALKLRYFAAFPTIEAAGAFDPAARSEYLAASRAGEPAEVKTATDDDLAAAYAEAYAKADKIKESRASYTKADVKGTCYYVSSIRGDDKNDGLSPEKPWKSFVNLYKLYGGGEIIVSIPKPGDGVFLECGSVFVQGEAGKFDYLELNPGVIYSSYGTGDKPVVTKRMDIGGDAGEWAATEWENVWRLERAIGQQPGNISFLKDGRESWGIFVIPPDPSHPFAGKKTLVYGSVSNGEETFRSGGVVLSDPGGLCHNLEYVCDPETETLYLFCDHGNPGEYYDRINVSLGGDAIGYNEASRSELPTRLDNIAVKHSGWGGFGTGNAHNVYVTNCTFEWIGGAYQGDGTVRFGNAIQNWGVCDGLVVRDCYFKDVYDAAVSTQGQWGLMRNFYTDGCVFDRCDFPLEFFNHAGDPNERSELCNIILTNNYVLRAGVGFCDARTDRRSAFLYTSYDPDCAVMENVRYENNVNIVSREYAIFSMNIACGDTAGTILKNNTYYIDPAETYIIKGMTNLREKTGSTKTFYPMTSRYLTYLQSIGVETGSAFYTVTNPPRTEP